MKRSYKQNCALAAALEVVGERWTLLIVRELLIGPRRYGELLSNLAGIGTNLLADRLKEMQANRLAEKQGQTYRLSAEGRRLEPVVWELVRFGLGLGMADEPEYLTRPEWDSVALRALYEPSRDAGLSGRYVLELNDTPHCVEKIGTDIRVTPGDCGNPRARVRLTKQTAERLAEGTLTLDDGIRGEEIEVSGSRREVKRLLASFGLG